MIDENFQPFLIEINTNPDITTCTPVCQRVIPPMLENAFRIAVDPVYPPPIVWPSQRKHFAPDNILENNKFDLVFDEIVDGPEVIEPYCGQKSCGKYFLRLPRSCKARNALPQKEV